MSWPESSSFLINFRDALFFFFIFHANSTNITTISLNSRIYVYQIVPNFPHHLSPHHSVNVTLNPTQSNPAHTASQCGALTRIEPVHSVLCWNQITLAWAGRQKWPTNRPNPQSRPKLDVGGFCSWILQRATTTINLLLNFIITLIVVLHTLVPDTRKWFQSLRHPGTNRPERWWNVFKG